MCVTCWVDEGHIWGCSPNLPCKIDIRCIQSSRVLCDLLPDGVRAGLREDLKVKLAEDEYDRHRKCAGQFHAVLPTRLSHAQHGADRSEKQGDGESLQQKVSEKRVRCIPGKQLLAVIVCAAFLLVDRKPIRWSKRRSVSHHAPGQSVFCHRMTNCSARRLFPI